MSTPVPLVDRDEERKRFRAILEEGAPRLITIRDRPGNGKSRLLQEFCDACYEIPYSLTLVSVDTIRTSIDLVGHVVSAFGETLFPEFRTLNRNRLANKFDVFATGRAVARVEGSVSGDAVVAGSIDVVVQSGAQVTFHAESLRHTEWTDQHELAARAECVRVFSKNCTNWRVTSR